MDAPRWLGEESELLALLNAALDRFDQLEAGVRQRDVSLPAERMLPSLQQGGASADQLWSQVLQLQSEDVLSCRSAVTQRRRDPYAQPWQNMKLCFAPDSEARLREWLQRPRQPSVMQQWQQAVLQQAARFPGDVTLLQTRRIGIPGRSAHEIVTALAAAASLPGPMTLRQLSAGLFWGDSKVLDERGELIAALFPQLVIRDRVMLVSVLLPERIDGVLFVENLDTYARALDGQPTALQSLAVVYAAGFAASAERIRSRGGASLHYSGPGMMQHASIFEHSWFDATTWNLPMYFWGDLDFSGMQILKSLRQRFGDVRAWQPGYESMLTRLSVCGGYGGQDITEQAQIDPVMTGCEFADHTLLPAIRQQGRWDQEGVCDGG